MKIHRIGLILGIGCFASAGSVLAAHYGRTVRPPAADTVVIAVAAIAPMLLAGLALLRDLAPLAALRAPLQALAGGRPDAPPDAASTDPRRLAQELAAAIDHAAERMRELEQARIASLAETKLLEYACNKMRAVLQCLPDGVLVLDPAGEVTFASGKVDPLLGVGVDEVLAQPPQAWCEDAGLRALLAAVRNGSPDARRRSTIEFAPQRVPDKHLSATVQPLLGAEADLAFGSLVVLRDATREHLARQAGNDFVAHVSHELKSPLNVIGMYAELLADHATDAAQRVESAGAIQGEVERMASLVNNLLNVSKLETGAMRPERSRVKVDDLLRDCFQLAQAAADARQVRLELQVARELSAVSIDTDLLRIALNNLMSNAIKYNHDGGSVTLAAEQNEREVVVSVRDTGIGMAPEDQARVTEKFFRVRETGPHQRGGHGLGLYLAKKIVELHQGRLELDSELGHGTTFSIHMQRIAATEGATAS